MESTNKPPLSFWIIACLAMVWNFIEYYISSYEMKVMEENVTKAELQDIESVSTFFITVFLVGLFAELLGSFALLMRKKIAVVLYATASFAMVIAEVYWMFHINFSTSSAFLSVTLPFFVMLIAVLLFLYARYAKDKGWIS